MEKTVCNLCGGRDFLNIHKDVKDEVSKESFDIIECTQCHLLITTPRPSEQVIKNYYPNTYYHYTGEEKYLSTKIARLIKEHHVSSPKRMLKRILSWILTKLLDRYVAIIIEGQGNNRKVLDVGCGDGRRVSWLIRYGYDVYGNEISADACKIAAGNGIKIFNGTLEEANYPSDFFDIIIFSQVFEHLHDPQKALQECYRILKKDGILIIDVPNIESLNHRIYGKYWFPLEVPRHLFHFSKETLERYLERNNFKAIHWRYRYPKFYCSASIKRIYKFGSFFLLIKSLLGSLVLLLFYFYPFIRNRKVLFSPTIAVYAKKK